MPRKPTGQLITRRNADGTVTFGARFPAYGKRHYITLGTTRDGMTRERAETELENVLADVRRGIWKPSVPVVVAEPRREQTFHEFASEWFSGREAEGLKEKTLVSLRWSLSNHLLPFFKDHPLSAIDPQLVDRYKVEKAAERQRLATARAEAEARGEKFDGEKGLSNGSINHTLRHLTQVLETAVDYGLIPTNPAAGKRRRLKAETPARPWVEPEQLMSLFGAADGVGRLLLELLAGSGLRIGEALNLRWIDVDLSSGTLYVRESKTDAGVREVDLTPALREALTLRRAGAKHVAPEDRVLCTSTGNRFWPSNLRRDVLFPAVATANVELERVGTAPIGRIGFHALRRTYASLRCLCGDDPRYTAGQLGHTDPEFTFRVYAKASKRRERLAPAQRAAFDAAIEWAQMGTGDTFTMPELPVPEPTGGH